MAQDHIIMKNATTELRVALKEFKGRRFVDIRQFHIGEDGPQPTQKGATVPVFLWPHFRQAVAQVEAELIDAGLIDRADLEEFDA